MGTVQENGNRPLPVTMPKRKKKEVIPKKETTSSKIFIKDFGLGLLGFLSDSLECLRMINGQVGEDLAVDLNTTLVQGTHQF